MEEDEVEIKRINFIKKVYLLRFRDQTKVLSFLTISLQIGLISNLTFKVGIII